MPLQESQHSHGPPPSEPIHLYGLDEAVFEIYLHEPPSPSTSVPETVVQDLWRTQQFDLHDLRTSDGAPLVILDRGTLNRDGGPDFRNARIRMAGQTWCGDVEVHTASDTWNEHRHGHDTRYNSVILHVVLYDDASTGKLRRADGTSLPELVLAPRLNTPLRSLLHRFYTQHSGEVACGESWSTVPARIRDTWIEKLALERVRTKMERLAAAYLHCPDLETLLYEVIMAGLGYAKNTAPMLTLARRIPLALARSLEDVLDLEALYLGVAGLLPAPAALLRADRSTSDYVIELRDRYERLKLRLDQPALPAESWQFFRLRPLNFPPLRIAQAVALLRNDPPGLLRHDPIGRLEAALLGPEPLEAMRRLLSAEPTSFWQTHVRLERASLPHPAAIGKRRADEIIVNAILPILLLHADQTVDPGLETAALDLLRRIPAEKDEITRKFERLGARPRNAFHTQGLHHLYRNHCCDVRCLACPVGRYILGL